MENLYTNLRNRKIHLNSLGTNYADGDYYLTIVEDLLPRLIRNAINNVNLDNITRIDKASDIKFSYRIYFLKSNKDENTVYNIDNDDVFVHASWKTIEDIKKRMTSGSYKKTKIIQSIELDKYTGEIKSVKLGGNLEQLMVCYKLELAQEERLEGDEVSTSKLIDESEDQIRLMERRYTDIIHDLNFEKRFLDGIVVNIIKERIKYINQRNHIEKNEETVSVDNQVFLRVNPTRSKDLNIKVGKEELDPLMNLINQFMRDYNLGSVGYMSGGAYVIKFNTNLASLMDAYYMEKQRIEHYTSGDYQLTKTDKNAKRLKLSK